jgi:excisionase family DNA binding protein
MKKELLTVPRAAGRMTVSVKTTWRMVYAGKLEVVRIGRCVHITGESVDDVIEDSTTPKSEEEKDDDSMDFNDEEG